MAVLRLLPPAAFAAVLCAACAPAAGPRPVGRDTVPAVPVVAPPGRVRIADGAGLAAIGFGRVLPDDEVVRLLERHGVLPYDVRLMAGEAPVVHKVPPEQASLGLVAEARRVQAEGMGTAACFLVVRLRSLMDRPAPAPGEDDPAARMMLSRIEMARAAPDRLRRGEPAVYGLKVAGTPEALRRLAADPLVREFNPAMVLQPNDEVLVPGPEPPQPQRVAPEVAALPVEEVRARVARLASEGLPECAEVARNADVGGRAERVQPGVVVQGIAFSARTVVDSARRDYGQGPSVGPTRATTTITLHNRTGAAVALPVMGCTEGVRIYRDPARAMPARPDAQRGVQCMQDPYTITLAPGESRDFPTELEADRVLGDSAPPGRYYLAATFRLRDRTLEIPAGEAELRTGREALRYTASAVPRRDTLIGRAAVINTARTPLGLEFGSCALNLRAYRNPERAGPPAWRSEFRGPPEGGLFYACDMMAHTAVIAPGDSLWRPFRIEVPLPEVLGDSLPDGRYWFTAQIGLNFGATPEIPAGDAVLAVPRRPLASQRTSGVMTFRAATTVSATAPRTVTAAVTGALSHAGGALERFAADCPVILYAYRTREERDAAPLATPVFTSHPRCDPVQQQYTLNRGESRTWRVHAPARAILGDSLPPGRYWFAVSVQHGARRLFLSAGDAQLTR